MATEMSSEVIVERLGNLQATVDRIEGDVRDMKDGSPIWRIQQMEAWQKAQETANDRWKRALVITMAGLLVSLVLAIYGAFVS